MAVNDLLGVIHTTVANFDVIPVEDFSKCVIFGKVLIYQVEKFVSDISADVFAEGGVIPENVVTLSISFSVGYAGPIC